MRLKISGIGKIGDSEIELNGITVIAGENNTGKSTFGKTLYCMFNIFNNKKALIRNERIDDISRIITNTFFSFGVTPQIPKDLTFKIIDETEETESGSEKLREDKIKQLITDAIPEQFYLEVKESLAIINEVAENVNYSLSVSNAEIQKIIISRYFENEFERIINHINKDNATGSISLTIDGKNIDVSISDDKCSEVIDNACISGKVIYLDTPFTIDNIQTHYREFSSQYFSNHRSNLRYHLSKKQSNKTLSDDAAVKQQEEKILSKIHSLISGEFIEDKATLMFMVRGCKKTLPLSNISSGGKTFLVIKRLLELGEIKKRDVLVFDEPENHLHPAWQLQFAELLVLLQKEFDLTILLTTHSPYFLNALEFHSGKHNIKERVNYYLAENNEDTDTSDLHEVTDNIDSIYKQLASPLKTLEDNL